MGRKVNTSVTRVPLPGTNDTRLSEKHVPFSSVCDPGISKFYKNGISLYSTFVTVFTYA
jgi:hypothetical protein